MDLIVRIGFPGGQLPGNDIARCRSPGQARVRRYALVLTRVI